MNKNKSPKNDKGQQHNILEYYWGNGKLRYKCVFINGKIIGLDEYYNNDETIRVKTYFL